MKLRSLILSVIALGGISSQAFAESIAIVNVQEIMHSSTAAKSIKDQLDAKQKVYQSEMSKKQADLQHEEQDLSKEKSVLSPEAFDKKLKEFRTKATSAEKEVQTKRAELEGALQSSLSQIQKTVFDIVSKIAKERGYTVVMPASQLLYADPKMDITAEVLAKLNSTLPKLSVSFKGGATAHDKDDEKLERRCFN